MSIVSGPVGGVQYGNTASGSVQASSAPRPVKAVLADTLRELREREAKLAKVADELLETRAAIRALTELVEDEEPGLRYRATPGKVTNVQVATASEQPSPLRRDEMVLVKIREHQPAPIGALVQATGLSLGQIKPTLSSLVDRGLIQRIGRTTSTRYWLTEDLDRVAAENNGAIPGEESE